MTALCENVVESKEMMTTKGSHPKR